MGALQHTGEHWIDDLEDPQFRKHRWYTASMKCQDQHVGRGRLVDVAQVTPRNSSAIAALRYTTRRNLGDDYELLPQVCGVGVDGNVHLAKDSDGKLFAVKSFDLSSLGVSKKQDLINEVKIGLAADHPHIVHVENVYETPEELHLVMEYLSGGELFSHLMHKGQFSEEKAAIRIRQMLLAIAYLHQHGVVHKDLKLENWMYEGPDKKHLKLIDFGVSECWDSSAPMHRICGSASYIAPEVFDESYTEKADMWSLGVMVYSLLTGRSLFLGSDAEVMRKIKSGRADWSSMAFEPLSPEAKQFVKALIVKDPLRRMSAAEALEHPWLASTRVQDPVPIHGGMVPNLLRFAHASPFKRACVRMLAWSLNSEDLEHLRSQFLALDVECRGALTIKQLKQSIGNENSLADMESSHALQFLDDDDEISYSEFIAAETHRFASANVCALTKTFQRLEPAGHGITVDHLLERLGSIDGMAAASIVAELNPNHNGVIGFQEFSSYLQEPFRVYDRSIEQAVSDKSIDPLEQYSEEVQLELLALSHVC